MPDAPTTSDPYAAPNTDPGRPDPAPAVGGAPPWSAAGDAAALNPLAPAEGAGPEADTPDAPWPDAAPAAAQSDNAPEVPNAGWPADPAPTAPFSSATDDAFAAAAPPTALPPASPPVLFDDASVPVEQPYGAPFMPESSNVDLGADRSADYRAPADDHSAGALPAWPAPAPAPGAYDYRLAHAGGADDSFPVSPAIPAADVSSAAAPSRPSVPWDPHQDGPPPNAASAPPGGRIAAAAGPRALYWVGGAVVVFLAFTALLFNVFVRSERMGARGQDSAANDASLGPSDEISGEISDDGSRAGATKGLDAPSSAPASAEEPPAFAAGGETGRGVDKASALQTATVRAPSVGAGAAALSAGGAYPRATTMPLPSARDALPPPSADAGPPGAAPLDGAIVVPNGYRRYDDAQHGFSLRVPSDWREAHRSAAPADSAASPDYDVIFESASGEQRLAVSVWDASGRPAFDGWLPSAATGMQPLDDGATHTGDEVPYNAFLGGEPSLVLGAAETPVSHLAYAAFLQHGERYLRVAWADMTGLTRPDDVLGALASFGWGGDELITGSAKGPNQVPRLSLPQGVYWPSEAVFGADGR